MVGVEVGADQPADRFATQFFLKNPLPNFDGFGIVDAGIDDRPAVAFVE